MKDKEIWLTLFNNILYQKGLITDEEKVKMDIAIAKYCERKKQ